ncbi:MAG: Arm DNA-binding domain-containing protein [Deltaproteobacteria bacterium]|nr:Arm DNA-binding domain-containing protein [Deltaproteobacteria bacterium]
MPLNDSFLRNLKPTDKPQKHSDGCGLYLYLAPTGLKSWRFDYRFDDKGRL